MPDLRVEVACATPAKQLIRELQVAEGTTAEEAIAQSGIATEFPDLAIDSKRIGIFGRRVPPGQVLREGDRVEIYRPLIADPKEARRKRAQRQSGD